jgi:hypothetical protein
MPEHEDPDVDALSPIASRRDRTGAPDAGQTRAERREVLDGQTHRSRGGFPRGTRGCVRRRRATFVV